MECNRNMPCEFKSLMLCFNIVKDVGFCFEKILIDFIYIIEKFYRYPIFHC